MNRHTGSEVGVWGQRDTPTPTPTPIPTRCTPTSTHFTPNTNTHTLHTNAHTGNFSYAVTDLNFFELLTLYSCSFQLSRINSVQVFCGRVSIRPPCLENFVTEGHISTILHSFNRISGARRTHPTPESLFFSNIGPTYQCDPTFLFLT